MKRFGWMLLLPLWLLSGCTQEPEVKNLIFLIGDGMGLAHVSMLEIEQDFQPTAFERAEAVALVATRSANNRVTDSAAAGTALATGCKTKNAVLGLTPEGEALTTMMELARDRGLATGLVVTSHLQHATPAAFYAHIAKRGDYAAINEQLVRCGFDVLIGGGRYLFEERHYAAMRDAGYTVVQSMEEADVVAEPPLLALVAEEYLPAATDRGDYLPSATRKALELLAQDDDGFLLMVEGSKIDGEGHANNAAGLLAEMRDFERTVAVAMDFADTHPGTLVVVTADHETGGLSLPSGKDDFTLSESGISYRFGTRSHSAVRVPAYFYGTGADRFDALMENTALADRLMQVMQLK